MDLRQARGARRLHLLEREMNDQESIGLLSPATSSGGHDFSTLALAHDEEAPVNGFNGTTAAVEPVDDELREGAGAAELFVRGLDWPVVIWIGVVHLMALAAPFFFTWQGVMACAALIFLTGSGGVCMGYHRLLTHGSFKTYRPVRWLFAFLGGLSGEGSALTWVANHRKHHHFSDKEGDPHSPRDGAWWSHMLWFMPNFGRRWHRELVAKYAPDILKDKMMYVLHLLFLPSHIGL